MILEANPAAHESIFGAVSALEEDDPRAHLAAEFQKLLNDQDEEEQDPGKGEDEEVKPEAAATEDEGGPYRRSFLTGG